MGENKAITSNYMETENNNGEIRIISDKGLPSGIQLRLRWQESKEVEI